MTNGYRIAIGNGIILINYFSFLVYFIYHIDYLSEFQF